jgi:hypothetical protein
MANGPGSMFSPTPMVPPGIDPQAYYDAQRRSALAQYLTAQSLSQPELGVGRSGPYEVQSKYTTGLGLTKLAQAVAAAAMTGKANQGNAAIVQQLYRNRGEAARALGDYSTQGSQPPLDTAGNVNGPAAIGAPNGPAAVGALPGGEAAINGVNGSAGPPQPPQDPQNRMTQAYLLAQRAHDMGVPDEIIKAHLSDIARTELEKNARTAGVDPAAYARGALAKGATLEMRPGGSAFDLVHGTMMTAPEPTQGLQFSGDASRGTLTASAIPGVAEQAGNVKGQQTAAEAINKPGSYETRGGGSTYGYASDILGLPPALRGGQQSQARLPGTAPAAPSVPTLPGAGAAGGNSNVFADLPKLNIPTGLGSPDAYTKAKLTHAAEKDSELSTKYGEQADMADQRVAFNRMALQVLSSSETGPLAARVNKIRSAAQEMGIPESMIPGWAKVAPSQELMKNLVRNAIVSLKPNFGARPAAAEFQILKEEANPSEAMTQLAIRRLLMVDSEKGEYEKQRADMYGQASQKGVDPQRFESWYAKKFPMADRLMKADVMPNAQRSVTRTGTLNGRKVVEYSDGSREFQQ